ncbi:MAG: sulfatase-like hydrolase/transferase [Planctomycetes bacterium]|nr:sulfatase-like hydrolase/transferase [Planctomycetota bacterium]
MLAGAAAYFAWPSPRTDFEQTWKSASAKGFNVVVVTLDTTRADRLSCYGHGSATTPVLDRLASQGVRFADAVSCVPMTLPAHASIFTGLDPPSHGVRSNGLYRLGTPHITLAEMLGERGYETAAFVSAFVLDARYGLNQGFDHYDDKVGAIAGSNVVQRRANEVTDAATRWLDARKSDKPFLLWVHYFDPHLGYRPPEPYATRFASDPYDGEIAYMDSQIGRLVDALGKNGGLDRTVLIVVADHGESLGEHHETEHSRTIYEATQHVPLILWAPGIDKQGYLVDDVVVTITDVFPTVLDLLGIKPNVASDGVSLLNCRAQGDRAVYMETMRTYLDHHWAPLFGLRRHHDKFILAPTPEYYDLVSDPHELNNIDDAPSRKQEEAMSKLAGALAERLKREPSAEAQAAMASAVQPDDDALRRLQSLGYLSGGDGGDDSSLANPKDMMPVLKLCLRAKSLRQAGKYEQALAKAEEALKQSPNDRTALREIGVIFAKMGRNSKAVQAFKQYLKIKPDADVCWTLAQILMGTGRRAEAQAVLRQALKLEPDHGGALLASGDLAALDGKYEKALGLYEKAKRVDPYRTKKMADERIARIRKKIASAP